MRTPLGISTTGLVLALAFGLSACSPSGNAPASNASPAPAAEPTAATAAPTPAPTEQQPATTTEATPAASPTPGAVAATVLASAEGEKPGLRVEVTEFKRSSGDTVNLKFVLINDSDEHFSFSGGFLGEAGMGSDYRTIGGVHLVDPVGKKKYLVVRDAATKCVCSTEVQDVKPKARVNLWIKFPAPPADVQKFSIVVPHFSPMDDVPLSQ